MLRRTPLKRSSKPLKRTRLRVKGHSTTAQLKEEIQSVLRDIVILRDGGCFLRNYKGFINPKYQSCGGRRGDGELILQAEHLHSRGSAHSFSDSRLVVCCCQRHHIYYKKEFPDEYYKIARMFIGEERSNLLTKVQEDHTPHKVDLKLELLALKTEYRKLSTGFPQSQDTIIN